MPTPASSAQPWRLLLLCVATQLGILAILGPIGPTLLQLQLCFAPERFRSIVGGWSAEELWRFQAHFLLDGAYPLLYGLLLRRRAVALALPRWVALAATAGAGCDVLENALHASAALGSLSATPDWVILGAAAAASTKWAVLLPVVLAEAPGSPLPLLLRKAGDAGVSTT